MNYYERYPGDYQRDTASLSLAEHGAYTMLLDTYYSTEAPLPADLGALYRICRAMSKAEQAAVRSVAEQFFPIGEDGLRHNDRADREIAKAGRRMTAARENGRKGGRPKKHNPSETQQLTEEKPDGFSLGTPAETHAGIHQTPDPRTQSTNQLCAVVECSTPNSASTHAPPATQASRPIGDWSPRGETIEALTSPIYGIPERFVLEQAAEFLTYWRDRDLPAASWDAKFIQRCASEWKRTGHLWTANPGENHAHDHRTPRTPAEHKLAAIRATIDYDEATQF